MSDFSSAAYDFDAILGGVGNEVIQARSIIRPSSSDLALIPGTVLQFVAATPQHVTVWDGQTNTTVAGILLEPITVTSSAKVCSVLTSGSFKNEHVNVYSDGDGDPNPTAAQLNQMQVQAGLIATGYEYARA